MLNQKYIRELNKLLFDSFSGADILVVARTDSGKQGIGKLELFASNTDSITLAEMACRAYIAQCRQAHISDSEIVNGCKRMLNGYIGSWFEHDKA